MPRTFMEFITKADDKELAALNKRLREYERQTKTADNSSARLISTLGKLTAGYLSLSAAINEGKAIVGVGLQFEQLEAKLKFATGSVDNATRSMKFLSDTANDLGLPLFEISRGFANFSAGAKGTALTTADVRDIFLGVSDSAAALKLSTDQIDGSFRALEQIISKGNVQAEELRGQLGERIPGAFQIAARAMGVTTAGLNEMLQKGEVLSTDFLPKFARELKNTFGKAAKDNANSATASFNRLNTEILKLRDSIARSGVLDFLNKLAAGATAALGGGVIAELREAQFIKPEDIKSMGQAIHSVSLLEARLQDLKNARELLNRRNKTGIEDNEKEQKAIENLLPKIRELRDQLHEIRKAGTGGTAEVEYAPKLKGFEEDLTKTVENSFAQGVIDAVDRRDLRDTIKSTFESVASIALQESFKGSLGALLAGASPVGAAAIGIGGLLLSQSSLFGSSKEKDTTRDLINALKDNEEAIRENTRKTVLEIVNPAEAEKQNRQELIDAQSETTETINKLENNITRLQNAIDEAEGQFDEEGSAIVIAEQYGGTLRTAEDIIIREEEKLAQARKDLAEVEGELAIDNAYNLVDAREAEKKAIDDQISAMNELSGAFTAIDKQYEDFYYRNIGLTQSGSQTVEDLYNRFNTELGQATIESVGGVGATIGSLTTEQLQQLAGEQGDVLNTGQAAIDQITKVYGSTQTAQDMISAILEATQAQEANIVDPALELADRQLKESEAQTALLETIASNTTPTSKASNAVITVRRAAEAFRSF